MQFLTLDGHEIRKEINLSKWLRRSESNSKSKAQFALGQILAQMFPNHYILEEFPINIYRNRKVLWLDFFMPEKKLAIECHGKQHTEYNPFFHSSKMIFYAARDNDNLKAQWCEVNDIILLTLADDKISEKNLKKLLSDAEF